jgi:hypothetical protein
MPQFFYSYFLRKERLRISLILIYTASCYELTVLHIIRYLKLTLCWMGAVFVFSEKKEISYFDNNYLYSLFLRANVLYITR